ncbi:MAG: glycoside hydrolase family 28 protein, partial [Flavobacterium sp.]
TIFEIYNAKDLSLKNVEFNSTSAKAISVNGEASQNIEFISSNGLNFSKRTTIGETVPKGAVKF